MSPLFEVLRRWPESVGALGTPFSFEQGRWVEETIRHGLSGWVVDALAEAGQTIPPALQTAARSQLAQGLKHKRFTLRVVDALLAVGITPTLLKGFGLASRIFPSHPFHRPSSDVDVLLAPGELPAAEAALQGLGLKLNVESGIGDAFEEHHHRAWASAEGLVEAHHRLFTGFGRATFDDQGLLQRRVSAVLEGRRVQYLGPEDELLYLAVHAANHSFLRLSWLLDLKAFLLTAGSLDWSAIATRARAANMRRPAAVALRLSERLLGAKLPPEAAQCFPRSLRGRLDPLIFSPEVLASAKWASEKVPAFMLHLFLTDTPGQISRHVFDGAQRALRRSRAAH